MVSSYGSSFVLVGMQRPKREILDSRETMPREEDLRGLVDVDYLCD